MPNSWNDERLEDRFDYIDRELGLLREDMGRRFEVVEAEQREMRGEISDLRRDMDERFDSMQRLILQVGGGTIATVIAGILAVLAS